MSQSFTIAGWMEAASSQLTEAGVESARLDSSLLLENVLKKPRDWIISHDDDKLSQKQLEILNKNLLQRKSRTPLAYIVGSKEFYGREFLVNKSVLIPRPESEDIISLFKQVIIPTKTGNSKIDGTLNPPATLTQRTGQVHNYKPLVILDIGTGSGILAVTAQLELPSATVIATDISKNALGVAQLNAMRLKSPVQFFEADLLDIPSAIKPDIILANLPYVPDELITSQEITKEPKLALFSGKDGLDHYKIFLNQVELLPNKPEVIITESLENQHADLIELALKAGYTLNKTETLAQLFVLHK